jgi:hypothetical protein
MCLLEIVLKVLLFVLLGIALYQFVFLGESFAPWNNYGGIAVRTMPSKGTGTTRHEKNYVSKKPDFKGYKKNAQKLGHRVSPITYRHITQKNLESFI